eukprot:scaffold41363_cov85-Cyclotella_meneghiniana.AAC.1
MTLMLTHQFTDFVTPLEAGRRGSCVLRIVAAIADWDCATFDCSSCGFIARCHIFHLVVMLFRSRWSSSAAVKAGAISRPLPQASSGAVMVDGDDVVWL